MNRTTSPYLIIIVVLGLIYGVLLTMNSVLFESTWFVAWAEAGDFEHIQSYMADTGHAFTYWYFRGLFALPNYVVFHKVLVWCLILITGCTIYRTLKAFPILAQPYPLYITLLALLFPIYFQAAEIYRWPHTLGFTAFFVATALYVSASKWNYRKILAIVFFILAFRAPSTLLLCYGFLAALWWNRDSSKIAFLKSNAVLLVLPILDYAVMKIFFPATGWFASYNQLNWGVGLVKRFVISCYGIFVEPFAYLTRFVVHDPFSTALLMVFVIGVVWLLFRWWRKQPLPTVDYGQWQKVLGFGVLLFLLAILPFNLTRKFVTGSGIATRNAFLCGLPIALIITSGLQLIRFRKVVSIGMVLILGLFSLMSIYRQILVQNHYIKLKSIGILIQQNPPPPSNYYLFSDRVALGLQKKITPLELKLQLQANCAGLDCFAEYISLPESLDMMEILKGAADLPFKWDRFWAFSQPQPLNIAEQYRLKMKTKTTGDQPILNYALNNLREKQPFLLTAEWFEEPTCLIELHQKTDISEIGLWWSYITHSDKQEVAREFMELKYYLVK